MSRFGFLSGLLILTVGTALAADKSNVKTGFVTVAFGYATDAKGIRHSIKGLQLPCTIEKIDAVKLKKQAVKFKSHVPPPKVPPVMSSFEADLGPKLFASNLASLASLLPVAFFDQTIYMADSGTTYGYFEEDDPSSLDDITLLNGANVPWKNLTLGFQCNEVPGKFLVRWRSYANMLTGLGHNVSAFNQEFSDSGVYIPASMVTAPGAYKMTINYAAANSVAPQDAIFVASQFRVPRANPALEDGEGAFQTIVHNVYNNAAPPTIGSSQDLFYYDWDDLNGIYSEDEVEQVSEGNSNLLFGLTAGGNLDSINPYALSVPQGNAVPGTTDIVNVWFPDDLYVEGTPLYTTSRAVAPLQFQFDAQALSTQVTSISFYLESSQSGGTGGTQTISLLNYQTGNYDVIDTRTIPESDFMMQVTVSTTPTKYLEAGTKRMKARIGYFPPLNVARSWKAKIDYVQWKILRP